MSATTTNNSTGAVAIIGMSGRWPRARTVAEFWSNVRDGVECIAHFSAEELEVPDAAALVRRPNYVKARSILEGVDLFDAGFFGVLPREAELMDPQHRVFLECCWEALEDAGYDPQTHGGAIGVYAGCSTNTYFLRNLCADRAFIDEYVGTYPLGNYPTMLGALADSLATRVAYKLNLRGPSLTIQSACSTSLVAVCQACQSLLNYQSDMALAGGVSITFPQKRGYLYQEGGMGSADGRCRAFDADASGTVFGSGAGVVLLKRLEDALAEGDAIHAVIKGFAVNNDGSEKVGYTAPGLDGQANVVAMAHAVADVDPETIGYLEAHGTATPLGDPIEFAALTRAFRARTQARGFCALGTVKMNVGHLEAAAGITGLINAVQALAHEQLPPAIGFEVPNPNIDLANSPFFVNTRLTPWKRGEHPRRAGVSSFGVGGTNAHVVLEEAPPRQRPETPRAGEVLLLSARSAEALDEATRKLAEHLKAHPDADLASVAYTLQAGRRAFDHRRAVVCTDVADAVRALESTLKSPSPLDARAPLAPDEAGAEQNVRAMLHSAGTRWVQGESVSWAQMHGPTVRRCSLPTYPFERKRFWIDPPVDAPEKERPREMRRPEACPVAPPASARLERLRTDLIDLFQDLSGLSVAEYDPSASFLEMGFDSLFLTQLAQGVQTRFGLRISLRRLLEQESTLDALAACLDAQLPAEPVAAEPERPPASAPPDPAPTAEIPNGVTAPPAVSHPLGGPPVPVTRTAIESIVREQLQAMSRLMDRQLEALGGKRAAAVPVEAAPAQPAAPPAAAPVPAPEFKAFGPYKPVQRGQANGLTERQARHLLALVRRYTARTAGSKQWTQGHRQVLADPRVVAGFRSQWKELVYPLVTVRSQGARLWDVDGNEYIDLLNGFGPILLGHGPEFVTEAVAAQLRDGFEIGPQTPLAGEVADLVRELTGNERVTFCNTGSEAVMAAIRVARTVTGRQKIVLFAGAYHGTFDEVLVKGIRKGGGPHSLPIAPGIPGEKMANVVVLDYGTPEALEYIRRHARDLAAVLVEPVQSRHPALQPVEFLREVRKITAAAETALIFDEIVTGFRAHPGGAQALFDIRADLVTYGKVVGGGLPIGILAGRAAFMDALDGGMWQYGDQSFPETGVTFFAGTFVRHPLALAAARAVLKHLKQAGPELQRALNDQTATLAQRLSACFEEQGVPARIEHFASWFYFSFPSDQLHASLLYYHLREKGIHIQEGFPCFLSTALSEADLDTVVRAFKESLREMQEGGFLPGPAASEGPPAAVAPREAPLTEAQMEIWLAAGLSDEASCAFNEALTLELRGPLSPPALRNALALLVARHDALRSTFDPGRNCLVVRDTLSIDMPAIDLSAQSFSERAASLERIIRADASQPFDLVAGPLVRVKWIQLGRDLHTLLFTTHHIVCDGWSTNVLLDELGQLYGAQCVGTPCSLPAPASFREHALAQAQARQTPERAAVESWWAEKFATPVVPLELPTDRPRGSVKSFRGDTVRRTIGAEPCQRLKRFGAQQGCTLFATLLAAFKVLLHRLSGQHDIVVGIPAAGQSLLEAQALVGHCVNFLPLRTSFEGTPSVATLLGQVRGTLLDAYDHQSYTYGSLVKTLGLRRDPSRLPLVEVQFNLERVGTGLSFPGLEARVDPCPKRFVNFDLFLNVVESDDGLVLDCDYNRDLFDPATIERWLQHLEKLIEGLASDPRQAVASLPLLSDTERQRLIVEWNQTRKDYPRDRCVQELIGAQAQRSPQAVAAACGDRQLTYAQLDSSTNRLAHFLRKRGVKTGDRVAICVDRSLEMLIGVLGILKAGAAYVPLDPEFPPERITAVIEDADPCLVLTQTDVAARLESMAAPMVCLDSVRRELAAEDERTPASATGPADPAYVIYTSGSTGKPKGVEVPHRAVVNLLCSMANRPGLTSEDTLLAVTTLAFDIAVLELYLPLCVGARVVIATRAEASDGNRLLGLLRASQTTVMQATPATWRLLLEAGWNKQTDLKVLCGGEALPRHLADALLARSASVWNMYGPTETTVWSATARVEPEPGPVTIGPPIANTEFYVLDPQGQPVPIGVAGELHIGGDGVARGYWNQPQRTAEKFIPDPFRGQPHRLYRTGDLVRYRLEGTLEFLGRLDTQVKVRGFRIETGEVEHVLKQYPGLRDCVVVAREDTPGDKRLVAYLVATPVPAAADLRRFLTAKLPSYMVPSGFVLLNALPQTPNGKIDRRALPWPGSLGMGHRRDATAPRNAREQTLAEVCADVLKLKDFGVHDSLFDLGADSLQVFQIVARANDAGLPLTPHQILAGRTIAAICEDLDRMGPAPARAEGPRLAPVSRDRYRAQRSQLNVPTGVDA